MRLVPKVTAPQKNIITNMIKGRMLFATFNDKIISLPLCFSTECRCDLKGVKARPPKPAGDLHTAIASQASDLHLSQAREADSHRFGEFCATVGVGIDSTQHDCESRLFAWANESTPHIDIERKLCLTVRCAAQDQDYRHKNKTLSK